MKFRSKSTHDSSWLFALKAGLLNAALVSIFSGVTIELIYSFAEYRQWRTETAFPGIFDFLTAVMLLLPITIVSFGSYGFIAGLIGGACLYVRRQRFTTTKRLLAEAAIFGVAASIAFPFYDHLWNREGPAPLLYGFAIPVGISCGLITARFFRKRLMRLEAYSPSSAAGIASDASTH